MAVTDLQLSRHAYLCLNEISDLERQMVGHLYEFLLLKFHSKLVILLYVVSGSLLLISALALCAYSVGRSQRFGFGERSVCVAASYFKTAVTFFFFFFGIV